MGGEKRKEREKILTLPQARFFAGLFTNLAAGWYGVVFITPSFGGDLVKLTKELILL